MADSFTLLRGPDRHLAQEVLALCGLTGSAGVYHRHLRSVFPVPDGTAEDWLADITASLRPDPDAMDVRSFRRGSGPVEPVALGHGPLPVQRALDVYRSGGTLVFQKIDSLVPGWHRIARAFEGATGQPVQMNLYVGPPDQPGLDWHRDPHDVIVLQLFGSKRFDLAQSLADGQPQNQHQHQTRADLKAGDLMCMARGTPHRVRNGPDGSIHVSIGLLHLCPTPDGTLSRCTDADQPSVTTRSFETLPPALLGQAADALMAWRGPDRGAGDPLAALVHGSGRTFLVTAGATTELDAATSDRLVADPDALFDLLTGAAEPPPFRDIPDFLTHGWSSP